MNFRSALFSLLISPLALLPVAGRAASEASDSAADPVYSGGWPQLSNGGSGFSAWTIGATNGAGVFAGDSSQNGAAPSGNINTAGRAWGMYTAGPGTVEAVRTFTVGGINNSKTLGPGAGVYDPHGQLLCEQQHERSGRFSSSSTKPLGIS